MRATTIAPYNRCRRMVCRLHQEHLRAHERELGTKSLWTASITKRRIAPSGSASRSRPHEAARGRLFALGPFLDFLRFALEARRYSGSEEISRKVRAHRAAWTISILELETIQTFRTCPVLRQLLLLSPRQS